MLRFIHHPAGSSAWNMAVDEALLRLCQEPILRCYSWKTSVVSIGYFQRIEVVPAGRVWIRRLTGGGLVDHAADFTYTVVIPVGHPLFQVGTLESYRLLHQTISNALTQIGVINKLSSFNDEINSHACFQKAVKFDVISPQRQKLAGAAQRRAKTGILHQGSIALQSDLRIKFTHTLSIKMATQFSTHLFGSELSEQEHQLALELIETRYSLDSWNQRR